MSESNKSFMVWLVVFAVIAFSFKRISRSAPPAMAKLGLGPGGTRGR